LLFAIVGHRAVPAADRSIESHLQLHSSETYNENAARGNAVLPVTIKKCMYSKNLGTSLNGGPKLSFAVRKLLV